MALRGKLETYNKQCGSVPQVCCPHCGQYTTFMKIQRRYFNLSKPSKAS